MKFNDALLLYKLILTRYSVRKSVIRKDPQKDYYSEVDKWSNIYAAPIGLGGTYSNNFEHIRIDYLVRWDVVLIRDGVRGGSNVAI